MLAKKDYLLAGLLFCCSFITFSPCLNNSFTWDDFDYIRDNTSIQQLSPHNLKVIFTSPIKGSYHPLTQLFFAIEYHFVRLNPWLYHLDNIILHALNTTLVFCLIGLFATRDIAFITALLFGIHPLRVESVAWAAERKDVLFSFFYLYALIQYGIFVQNKHKNKIYTCFGLFILAILAKPQASSLPLALLSMDYLLKRKWDISLLKEKIPFFIVSFLSILGAAFSGKQLMFNHQMLGSGEQLNLIDKLIFSGYAFLIYIYNCILPLNLSVLYFYPSKINGWWPLQIYLAPWAVLTGFIALFLLKMKRPIVWALIFFCITIMLPLGNIWIGGIIADRYSYLPSIGVFFILSAIFLAIYKKYPYTKWFFLIYACILCVSSFSRCAIWKNYLTMTDNILLQHPNSDDAYDLRGQIYVDNGRLDMALNDFNKAITLNPGNAFAYYNRGVTYFKINDMEKALQDLNRAISLRPLYLDFYLARGTVYLKQGRHDLAFKDFESALLINPDDFNALFYSGTSRLNSGEIESGIQELTKAIRLYPNEASLYLNRGAGYMNRKQDPKDNNARALADFERAIAINPDYEEAYLNRGLIYANSRNYTRALADYEKAIVLNPADATVYYNRAIVYYHIADYGKSWQDVRKAQAMGFNIDNKFLEGLKQISGMNK